MNIAICDDEAAFANKVKKMLDYYAEESNIEMEIDTFDSGYALLGTKKDFDIAVLDVEMPDIDGIEVGKKLRQRNKNTVLIYITAYGKYLDDSLDLNAFRFFEKPIDEQRFYRGIDRAVKRVYELSANVVLKENSEIFKIPTRDIIFIEIEGDTHRKTHIVTEERTYISAKKMEYWEKQLADSNFVKPHKSYLINLDYVTKYNETKIQLANNYSIPVSRGCSTNFRKRFFKFIMSGV